MEDGVRTVGNGGCEVWPLPGDPTCARIARRTFRRAAGSLSLDPALIDDGEMIVSELAANTLHVRGAHSRGGPELWLYVRSSGASRELVCKVFDAYPGWLNGVPGGRQGRVPSDSLSGRGLAVVHELSGGHWGYHLTRARLGGWHVRGKAVWFALPVTTRDARGAASPASTVPSASTVIPASAATPATPASAVNAGNGTAASASAAAPGAVLTATLNWTAGNGGAPDHALALDNGGIADNAGIAGIGTITAAGTAAWRTGTATAANGATTNGTITNGTITNGTITNGSRPNGTPATNGSGPNGTPNSTVTNGSAANGIAATGTDALTPVVATTASEAMTELEAALGARGFGRMLVRAEDHAADMAVLSVCNGITVWCADGAACLRAPSADGADNQRWGYGDLIELTEQVVEAYETMAGGFAVPQLASVSGADA